MEEVKFGRMADGVSKMGLGAWALGSAGYGPVEKDKALEIIDCYITGGGDFIDTAMGYKLSQEIIGEYFKTHPSVRNKIFLCSKTGWLGEDEIKADVETSLKSMNTDYIDLYYLHAPPTDPRERDRVIAVFDGLKSQGLIRGIGASIKGPNVTEETQILCNQYMETGLIDAIQLIYSILRQTNSRVFETARKKGVAIVARTALESGFLTGKYKPGHSFSKNDHRSRWSREDLDRILKETQILEEQIEGEFSSLSQKALRFVYDEPGIDNMIVGATSPEQMKINLAVADMIPPKSNWREPLIKKYGQRSDLGNFS
jgi:myo-inositol catabolism protein IolS